MRLNNVFIINYKLRKECNLNRLIMVDLTWPLTHTDNYIEIQLLNTVDCE